MTIQTLEQQRAKYAWAKVQGCDEQYTSLAKGAPALIMSNGLMQSLAFYASKDKQHHKCLNAHILGWLYKRDLVERADFASVMNSLHNACPADYRRATAEALELLKWVRQLAPVAKGA